MQIQTRRYFAVFAALTCFLLPPPFVFGFGRARLPARLFQEATAEQQRAADRAGVHPRHGTARRAQTGQRSFAGRDPLSPSARCVRASPPC